METRTSQPDSDAAARNNRIEALKALTRTLLKEIEALSETQPKDVESSVDLSEEVKRYEAHLIRCALIRTGGRQRRAARLLNMKVATLNAKIKRYHLNLDETVNAMSESRGRNNKASDNHAAELKRQVS